MAESSEPSTSGLVPLRHKIVGLNTAQIMTLLTGQQETPDWLVSPEVHPTISLGEEFIKWILANMAFLGPQDLIKLVTDKLEERGYPQLMQMHQLYLTLRYLHEEHYQLVKQGKAKELPQALFETPEARQIYEETKHEVNPQFTVQQALTLAGDHFCHDPKLYEENKPFIYYMAYHHFLQRSDCPAFCPCKIWKK